MDCEMLNSGRRVAPGPVLGSYDDRHKNHFLLRRGGRRAICVLTRTADCSHRRTTDGLDRACCVRCAAISAGLNPRLHQPSSLITTKFRFCRARSVGVMEITKNTFVLHGGEPPAWSHLPMLTWHPMVGPLSTNRRL
jgi:hypothetical protein